MIAGRVPCARRAAGDCGLGCLIAELGGPQVIAGSGAGGSSPQVCTTGIEAVSDGA